MSVHQCLDIGQGEVGFDGILTTRVFAWEERAKESSIFIRDPINDHLGRWQTKPSLISP